MNEFQMYYDDKGHISPIYTCYNVNLSKPINKFGKEMYTITLAIDSEETEYRDFINTFKKFETQFKEHTGLPVVKNKCIYMSQSNREYCEFSIKSKGQRVPVYNDDGEPTEPPIDGDRVQVNFSFAGWRKGNEAGIKVYLNSVVVVDRVGTPKTEKADANHSGYDDDMW